MLKLDLKDKKILTLLDKDARMPLSTIASNVGLSKQVVDYRIKKLIANHVINGFTIHCDLTKLGYSAYGAYLRLRNLTEKKEQSIISLLVKHPFVKWVVLCEGRWDLAFSVAAKNMLDFESVLEEILAEIGDNVEKYEISTVFTFHEFYLNLLERKEPYIFKPPRKEFTSEPATEKIDAVDMRILNELQINSRSNHVEIAKKLNLTPDLVRYRIKNLVNKKIIVSYHTQINFKTLGYSWYLLILDIRGCSITHEKEILEKVKQLPNLAYVVRCLGFWDFEIHLQAGSNEEFRKALMTIRSKLEGIINSHDTVLILEKYKNKNIPEGIMHEFSSGKMS